MKNAFTLIELLIVTSLVGILLTMGVASHNTFNRRRVLRETALALLNNLRHTQTKALSGEKPNACTILNGWKLEFLGGGYQMRAVCTNGEFGEKNFSFPSGVSKTAGPDSFLFKVLAHGVKGEGEIGLSGFGEIYKIKVSQSGEITDVGFE